MTTDKSGTFWDKNVVLFLASQIISIFGSSLVHYATMWYITLETKSGIMMTISIICATIPTLLVSPFAGVWADRYSRKLLIVLSDAFTAVATLILAILFLMGYKSIGLILVITAIRALGSGIQTPAIGAFLPQITEEEKLTKVNAVNGSLQSFVLMLSPMLSGALLTVASIEMIFFIDVITAAIAISVMILFLHAPIHKKALEKQSASYFEDLKQGFIYIGSHEYIKRFFLFCAVFFVLVAPVAFLTPLQVARSFGSDVWRLTAIEVAFSIGMILGGIALASWGGFKNKVHTMTVSSLLLGGCTMALGATPVFWIYIFFMAVSGVAMPLFSTPATVLLQEKVEGDYLGRVFGVLSMISNTMMPLGMLVFGPLADVMKIEWMLLITGALIFVMGFYLLSNRIMLEAGRGKP
ncbi:MAG: MFS transporter [Clostridiaceae bacterium]